MLEKVAAPCRMGEAGSHKEWMIRMVRLATTALLLTLTTQAALAEPVGSFRLALEAQRSYVHCVNGRASVEQWDEEQMRVRHGSNVCQLRSFTSGSSAQSWRTSNYPTGRCSC